MSDKKWTQGQAEQDVNTVWINDVCIADCYPSWTKGSRNGIDEKANAAFIAEAFNVATETGCTPRELAEQRDQLVSLLNEILPKIGYNGDGPKAHEIFYCEFCGEYHKDSTQIPHTKKCPCSQGCIILDEIKKGTHHD